jgi:hypothetical protein
MSNLKTLPILGQSHSEKVAQEEAKFDEELGTKRSFGHQITTVDISRERKQVEAEVLRKVSYYLISILDYLYIYLIFYLIL